jgi:hypothetical protein
MLGPASNERTFDYHDCVVKYLHSDLGNRSRGDVLVVTLTRGANVRLLDSSNFSKYKQGKEHRFHGGRATKSPVQIPIPRSGRWHAVVDMQGLKGATQAGFKVFNGAALKPLPPIREPRQDLAGIADNIAGLSPNAEAREFDVFVSHATEDKDLVVRPLAGALQERGLSVWYDEFELRVGDSLRRSIDRGIANSRFGVVVLSHPFFAKGWPQYELDGLVTMSVSNKQVLLPTWHDISKEDLMLQSPSLADKVALRTADLTIAEIADEISLVVMSEAQTAF